MMMNFACGCNFCRLAMLSCEVLRIVSLHLPWLNSVSRKALAAG